MEILVVTWNYPPRQGGMEQLLANVCGGLSQNHRVTVLTAYAEKNFIAGGETVFRPAAPGLIRYFLFACTKGIVLLRGNRSIRVVFGGSVLVTPIVVLLARLFRRKAIIQAHGLDLIYRNWLYQGCVVRCLRYADRVIANSRHTAKLATRKGVAVNAIVIIPPGVECERFQVAENVESLKAACGLVNRKIILFVGRLVRRKGVKEFIENSFVDILKRVPHVCFVVAGDNPTGSLAHDDDVADEIRQAIIRLGLSGHVLLRGAVSDTELVQLYALCDVVVLPVVDSDYDVEGFGMVALEAAAAGKPVVATRAGGVEDAVSEDAGGVLVDAQNYPEFSRVVICLLQDSSRAASVGVAGRQRVLRYFDWSLIVAHYEAELNDVVAA
jgi:phosphatidylinositol alpha-1,6-mannosyltransferase